MPTDRVPVRIPRTADAGLLLVHLEIKIRYLLSEPVLEKGDD